MFKILMWFFAIFINLLIVMCKINMGPHGVSRNGLMNCSEFSKNARFNPYSVLGDTWFIFYYWGSNSPKTTYKFSVPTRNETAYLHYLLDRSVKGGVDWSAKQILMKDKRDFTTLLVERNDRGHYWMYMLFHNLKKGQKVDPVDMRIKQTSDNKYMGMMVCDEQKVAVLSRMKDIPPKNKIQGEASKIGYSGRDGRSYLYQGNQWMPTGDAEDREMWRHPPYHNRHH